MELPTAKATRASTDCLEMGQTLVSWTCSLTSQLTASTGSRPAPETSHTMGGSQKSGFILISRFDKVTKDMKTEWICIQGNIWGVARNEDGDESGWGSRTFFASHDDLSQWDFVSEESDPWIYESPKMFRHGSDLFLVARTDPG